MLELSSERSALQRAPPGNGDPLSDPAESDAGPTAPSSRTEWEVGTLEGLGFALALAPGPVVSDKEDEKDSRPCQIQFQFMSVVGWYLPLSVAARWITRSKKTKKAEPEGEGREAPRLLCRRRRSVGPLNFAITTDGPPDATCLPGPVSSVT